MNYENFKTGFNKHAIFTAETYGTKTTVDIDHSDLSLDEVMDAFKTLIVGMGYNIDLFNQWVKEMADELRESEPQPNYDEEYQDLRHSTDDRPHWNWDEDKSEKRMDIIGQNGNEGTHYYKDSDGFENYQFDKVKYSNPISQTEYNLNRDKMAEELKTESKKVSSKKKKKTVEDWEDNFDLGGHE